VYKISETNLLTAIQHSKFESHFVL